MIRGVRTFHRDEGGSAAVEFVLLIPGMVLLIFAIVQTGLLVYSEVSLHWTVEQASRCAVVSEEYTTPPAGDAAVSCTTIANTQTYAGSVFNAPVAARSFVARLDSTNSCKEVTASATYYIQIWMVNWRVPLTAKACYPTVAPSWS
jgi:Flp pilus assembly protein TadG